MDRAVKPQWGLPRATSEGHGFASLFLSIQLRTYISLHSISREGVASVPFHFHSKSIVALWSSSLIWRGLPVGTLTLSQPFPLISILLAPEKPPKPKLFAWIGKCPQGQSSSHSQSLA